MLRHCIAVALLVAGTRCPAADWNQWRGPARDGLAPDSPSLLSAWPESGPPLVWRRDAVIPAGDAGGYSSVVVSGGRVYLYASPRVDEALETRTLSESLLRRLGWQPDMPAETVLLQVEAARLSSERQALDDHVALRAWIDRWMEENLDERECLAHGGFVRDRLRQGTNATALTFLHKLELLISHPFANTNALEAWMAEHALVDRQREQALSVFPVTREVGQDVIFCLDAMSGRTLWEATFPGVPRAHGASSTPCIADGRCYVIGSGGMAYCLDAETGTVVWQEKLATAERNSSFIVADGMAIILADRLTALAAATGKVLWQATRMGRTNSSPVTWRRDGRTFLLCSATDVTRCFDLLKGILLWEVPDGGDATPVIAGDRMLIWSHDGLSLYHLDVAGATRVWRVDSKADYGSSPCMYDGYAYAMGGRVNLCVNLETGTLAWQERVGTSDYTSPVIADGKIFAQARRRDLVMLAATPAAGRILARAPLELAGATSAAMVDGRIYLRLKDGLACYDLRRKTVTGGAREP